MSEEFHYDELESMVRARIPTQWNKLEGDLEKYKVGLNIHDSKHYIDGWAEDPSFKLVTEVVKGDSVENKIIFKICITGEYINYSYDLAEKVKKNSARLVVRTLAYLELEPYPACCALYQVNNFCIAPELKQEEVTDIMDAICAAAANRTPRAKRLIFNFVELTPARVELNYWRARPSERFKYMLKELKKVSAEEIEKNMQHKELYLWAKKQAGFQEVEYYNANSGNVIHTAFVIPSINF